jgi:APA family basic amino acid/polyamine antiporter
LLVVGNIIGAGIFTTSGFLASELPHPFFFISIWIIGGLLTFCGALTYAELAGMFPYSGGDYHFLKAAYGRWAGFLVGWVSFWIINPGSIAALSLALVSYMTGFLQVDNTIGQKSLAIGIIVLLSLINYRGIRWSGTTQNIFTAMSLCILATLIAGGILSSKGSMHHFTAVSSEGMTWVKLFGPAMIAVIFTYSGWFASAYIGSEIKRPERTLPLSLLLGTITVTILYTLVNMTYLYALPLSKMTDTINIAQQAAVTLFSPQFAQIVTFAIMFAIVSSINATVLTGPRIYYAMAKDTVFWSPLKRLHPVYGTPHYSIVSQMCLACLFVIAGTFEQLLSYVVFVILLSSLATGIAHLVLRWRRPEIARPYRTWGYPVTPLLYIDFYIFIAGQIAWARPSTSILGVLIMLSGLPFYMVWSKINRPTRDTENHV